MFEIFIAPFDRKSGNLHFYSGIGASANIGLSRENEKEKNFSKGGCSAVGACTESIFVCWPLVVDTRNSTKNALQCSVREIHQLSKLYRCNK